MSHDCYFQDRFDPERPYDVCIECPILNAARCDGPNPLAMTPSRRVEFLQKRRDYLKHRDLTGWSYDSIADKTNGVSRNTVMRILADPTYDPGAYALGEVMRVLIDGSWGQYPCGIHSQDEGEIMYIDSPETLKRVEELMLEVEHKNTILNGIHDSYKQEFDELREGEKRKIDHLLSQVKHLEEEVEYLRIENNRKAKIIDKYME